MLEPHYWSQAKKELSKADPKMAQLIKQFKGEQVLSSLNKPYQTLAKAIVGQQISVAAANAVWERFNKLLKRQIVAKNVLAIDDAELRSAGLSRMKVQYLKNIAEFFIKNKVTTKYFEKNDHKQIKKDMLAIKGIGPWTYEMFEIFYLNEPDIFPIKDIGLIKAIQNIYANGKPLSIEKILKLSKKWQPWRTVATWYLWRTTDVQPVQY